MTASATTSYKLAAVNEDWAPLSGVQVEAINLTTLKPDDVQRTALNGVVTFTGLPAGPHIFRVRARRVSTKVGGRTYTGQVRLIPIAMGNQGISKHYVVDANGMGTHTTVQAAITAAIALGAGFEVVIYINPGAYTEDLAAPFASTGGSIYLVGEGAVVNLNAGAYNSIVTITGSSGSSPVLEATGVGTIAAVGIEFAQKGGGTAEVIKLAVNNDLEMYECKLVACAGQRVFTAVIDVRCRNCVITAGSGRIIDPANAVYFEHCYLNGAGLMKGNFDLLTVKDCILVGTAPAGEYWIHEAALVVSRRLYVIGCESSAGGGSGFISFGDPSAVSTDCIITNNKINVGSGQIGIRLIELVAAVVTDNIIRGTSNADGSTAISLAGAVGGACRACVVAHNSIYQIQTGINRGTDATDGTCVIGPNAFYDVGTNTTGVPAAEDYQTSLATVSCALLDGTIHTDTVAQAVSAGSMIIGDDTPEWNELVISVPAANVRNVLGIDNGETLPSWKTALDGTNPANIANSASPGTSLVFAHRDHVHAHPAGLTANLHHAKYLNSEAIAAVEGEATLVLAGDVTIAEGKGLSLGGSAVANSISVATSDTDDPYFALITTLSGNGSVAHEVRILLDQSGAADHLEVQGQTAAVDTVLCVKAVANKSAILQVHADAGYGRLIMGAGGGMNLKNTVEDGDIRFTVDDGGTDKYLYIDGATFTLLSSTGLIDLGASNLAVGGTLTVDVINEATGAAGVTIEGTQLIDSTIYIGGDAGFFLTPGGGSPIFAYDSNDYWQYVRATNTLNFVIGGAVQFSFVSATASFPRGTVVFGTADLLRGVLVLTGHNTGAVDGGEAQFHLSADHDGTFEHWLIKAYEDDLAIVTSNGAAVNKWTPAGQLQMLITGSGAGILMGGDAQIYRGAANRLDLAASDALVIHGGAGDFAAPVNGMLWYNTTSNKLRVYEGGAWADVV